VTATDVADRVAELVEPLLDGAGHELYDVVLAGATLRVLVAGGADLDELARLTREISALLDEADPIPDRYTLEVSSPGLERTLRTPRHFAGAVGEKIKVKTIPSTEGDRRADGTLVSADDDGIVVDTGTGERRLAYGDIDKARTVFEWGNAPKPVSPSKKGTTKR
jgi:ribosome maturation factor RimP